MPRFMRKAVAVEAFQMDGWPDVEWVSTYPGWPQWMVARWNRPRDGNYPGRGGAAVSSLDDGVTIGTEDGGYRLAKRGDWIILDEHEHLRVMHHDEFKATHEPVRR